MTRLNSGIIILVVAALLLAVPSAVVFAQGNPKETGAGGGGGGRGGGGAPGGSAGMGGGAGMGSAVPSSGSGSSGSSWGGGSSGMSSGSSGSASGYGGDSRRATNPRGPFSNETTAVAASPWYSRPRGENPPTGTATLRPTPAAGTGGSAGPAFGGPANNNEYYPGAYYGCYSNQPGYPGGGGCFSNGYGYYSPFGYGYYGWAGFQSGWWGDYSYYYDPFWSGGYGGGYASEFGYGAASGVYAQQRQTGSIRLKVKPNNATVYVDGYYTGRVDDYDGIFQRLRLEPGPHKIEISAQGFKSISFEVNIRTGENINFQGELEIIK